MQTCTHAPVILPVNKNFSPYLSFYVFLLLSLPKWQNSVSAAEPTIHLSDVVIFYSLFAYAACN